MAYSKDYSYASQAEKMAVTTAQAYRDMFGWMACGLGLTALSAFFVMDRIIHSSAWAEAMLSSSAMWILMIASFVMVFAINGAIHRLSFSTATLLFAGYSVLMGAWISPLLLVYTGASVAKVFFITAGTFAGMAAYGHFTKSDLSSVGKICIMALWGIIIASVVNIFMKSAMFDYVLSYVAVAVFCGLTMYDVQKFKAYIEMNAGNGESLRKIALIGALELYLDFLNIFIRLLHILGDRR